MLAGCGSGGSGGNGDIPSGVSFTEDTSLDESISGIWIATSEGELTEEDGDFHHTFKGTDRRTFYVIEDLTPPPDFDWGDVLVADCKGEAIRTEYDASTLVFSLNGVSYSLQKQSNTRFSGTIHQTVENTGITVNGTATMIKIKPGPNLGQFLDLVLGDNSQELGTVSYAYNGQPAQTMGVDCYTDGSGSETYSAEGETEFSRTSGVILENFSNESIDIEKNSGDSDTDYLDLHAGGVSEYFASDAEAGRVDFDFDSKGNNDVTITFNAGMIEDSEDNSSRTTTTLEGTADLSF